MIQKNDVNLIDAAPEMFELLKEAVSFIDPDVFETIKEALKSIDKRYLHIDLTIVQEKSEAFQKKANEIISRIENQ